MPFSIVRNDITKMRVDAIVNAANTALQIGGGVCGAIFLAAGANVLQNECDKIGGCQVGDAVITKGYKLPAKHIIHTVGPIWQGGNNNETQQLANCYTNSLNLALKHGLKSIAFPLISSGIYGYPKAEALDIAVSSIREFLLKHDMKVYLVVFDKKAFVLSEKLVKSVEKFIDDKYVETHTDKTRSIDERSYNLPQTSEYYIDYSPVDRYEEADEVLSAPLKQKRKRNIEDVVAQLDESFSEMLLRLIDERGISDVEAYKNANIDRKLFSKIRSNKAYNPSKITAIAFAISLKLSLDETLDLLSKAGYTLSHSNKFDLIIEYFITEENYNIYEINEVLFEFDQVLLGA